MMKKILLLMFLFSCSSHTHYNPLDVRLDEKPDSVKERAEEGERIRVYDDPLL